MKDIDEKALKWAQNIFDAEASSLAVAPKGDRNNQLNKVAFKLGQLEGAGLLSQHEVEASLLDACAQNGLLQEPDGEKAVRQSMQSGLNAGRAQPRFYVPSKSFGSSIQPSENTIYKYYDAQGKLIAEKERRTDRNGNKSYIWRRPISESHEHAMSLKKGAYCQKFDGNPNWYPLKNEQDHQKFSAKPTLDLPELKINVPYQLGSLLKAAQENGIVCVAEGEKDVATIENHLKLSAVCGPNGCNTWNAEMAKYFHGVGEVIVFTDNDSSGKAYGQKVIGSLRAIVPIIKLIELPRLPAGGDVTDWLEQGIGSIEGLQELMQNAPNLCEKQVVASRDPDSPYSTFQLADRSVKVLGHNNQSEIIFWDGRIFRVSLSNLTPKFLNLRLGIEENHNEVMQAIIAAARQNQIHEESTYRSGIHPLGPYKWLLISGKRCLFINDQTIQEINEPIFGSKFIEHEEAEWLDVDLFIAAYESQIPMSQPFCKLREKVGQWSWKEESMVDYVTSFVMLSPFQTAMSWRPWLYITGPFGCGKSLFLEQIFEVIYGSLAKRLDKSTSHAIAQTIGNQPCIPILDEFEKMEGTKINRILDTMLMCNRAGFYMSGTTGPKAHRWRLKHMLWFASINTPTSFEQDAAKTSRLVLFELNKVSGHRKPPIPFSVEEARQFAAESVASVMQAWPALELVARNLGAERESLWSATEQQFLSSHLCFSNFSRVIDNIKYAKTLIEHADPLAMTPYVPKWLILGIKEDQVNVLDYILNSRPEPHRSATVADLLHRCLIPDPYAQEVLRGVGITIKHKKDKSAHLGLRLELIERYLLKDVEHLKGCSIRTLLLRLEGVLANQDLYFGKSGERITYKGITVPWHYIESYVPLQKVKNSNNGDSYEQESELGEPLALRIECNLASEEHAKPSLDGVRSDHQFATDFYGQEKDTSIGQSFEFCLLEKNDRNHIDCDQVRVCEKSSELSELKSNPIENDSKIDVGKENLSGEKCSDHQFALNSQHPKENTWRDFIAKQQESHYRPASSDEMLDLFPKQNRDKGDGYAS